MEVLGPIRIVQSDCMAGRRTQEKEPDCLNGMVMGGGPADCRRTTWRLQRLSCCEASGHTHRMSVPAKPMTAKVDVGGCRLGVRAQDSGMLGCKGGRGVEHGWIT